MNNTPFRSYVWKLGSRCNLNCSYCYVYNGADTEWSKQPKLMNEKTARKAAFRILDHCIEHKINKISISFHGGEPMLGGISQLDMIISTIKDIFTKSNTNVRFSMQSNGLLFSEEIGDLLLKNNIMLGISLDGPPEVNDLFRVNHNKQGMSYELEKKLDLIISKKYNKIFSGFLNVINVKFDPIYIIKYLLSYNPPNIDFLLPDYNFDFRPLGKENDLNITPYGDWLIKLFNYWYNSNINTKIRIFESIICLILGNKSYVEYLGLDPINYIIIETNGDIEVLDALKTAYNGATQTGYNIFNNSFDDVSDHPSIRSLQIRLEALCDTCKQCPIVKTCGGGFLPHRYSKTNGFNNPSIYCSDLKKLIGHIETVIHTDISVLS